MKQEFIPGEIIPNSSPIAEAAIIRLKRDAIRNPPATAFLYPNNLDQRKAGIIFTANKVINNKTRNKTNDLSNSSNAAGSNLAPTIMKNTGMKNPNPMPSNFTISNERSLCKKTESNNPLKKAPNKMTSSPIY